MSDEKVAISGSELISQDVDQLKEQYSKLIGKLAVKYASHEMQGVFLFTMEKAAAVMDDLITLHDYLLDQEVEDGEVRYLDNSADNLLKGIESTAAEIQKQIMKKDEK